MTNDKSLKFSYIDGCLYSFMVGLGETYIAAFVLTKGFSEISASLITTIPLLAGGLLQMFSPYGVFYFKSYKKWVTKSASLQGVSLILLALTSFMDVPVEFLFLIASLYWAGGMSTGPAWNSWMTKLVPQNSRLEFFSHRSMYSSLFVFLGIVAGGLVLQTHSDPSKILSAYFGIFMAAGIFRLFSSHYLSKHTETPDMTTDIEIVPIKSVFKKIGKTDYGQVLKFIFIFQFGVHFSSSFFNPFMLKELAFSPKTYMVMMAIQFICKVIAQPLAQKIVNKIGLQRTLLVSIIGIIPLPLVWTVSGNLYYLALMQALSGFVWGIYELVTFMILFNQIPIKERTQTLTFFNLAQNISIICGSVLAGILFKFLGTNYQAYIVLFYVSTALRFAALAKFPDMNQNVMTLKDWILLKPLGTKMSRGDLTIPFMLKNKSIMESSKLSKKNVS